MRQLIERGIDTWNETEPPRKVPVREVTVGDVLRLNDWQLHVIAVEHDVATAVLTSELGFLLHFTRDETVEIVAEHRATTRSDVTPATNRPDPPARRCGGRQRLRQIQGGRTRMARHSPETRQAAPSASTANTDHPGHESR